MAMTVRCRFRRRPLRRMWAPALCVLLAAIGGAPVLAALQPSGPEVVLDPEPAPSCGGDRPDVAALAGGGFVVSWVAADGVWVRRLDAAGAPVGPPSRAVAGAVGVAAVAARPGGGFSLVWFDATASRIEILRFDAAGGPGSVEQVATVAHSFPRLAPVEGLDVAGVGDDSVVVVWATGWDLLSRRMVAPGAGSSPPAVVVATADDPLAGFTIPLDPTVVISGSSQVVAWTAIPGFFDGIPDAPRRTGSILARRLSLGPPAGPPFPGPFWIAADGRHPAVAAAADGGFLVAWAGVLNPLEAGPVQHEGVLAQGYGPDDQPRSRGGGPVDEPTVPVRVDEGAWFDVGGTVATPRGDHFVVAWLVEVPDPLGAPLSTGAIRLREVNQLGEPLGGVVDVLRDERDYYGQAAPALAANAVGRVEVVWGTTDNPLIGAPPECLRRVRAQAFASSACANGATSLCVQGGRFELSLVYEDPRRALSGIGHPVRLTDDTAYFWFFAAHNVEVVVKVIDGRGLNGHFWVFYGGLTDLGFTLLVRDTATGASRAFTSPAGTIASRGVTDAFPPPAAASARTSGDVELHALRRYELVRDAFPAAAEEGATPARAATPAIFTDPNSAAGPCSPPELPTVPRPGLCLTGRRFEVEASWRDFAGRTGHAEGVPLAAGDDSGYFWFFAPANVELMVKVLDGRAVNGKFWVFYAALSNVEYDLRVRHVFGDGQASYHNPLGTFASRGDTGALTPPTATCACPEILAPVCGHDGRTYGNACMAHCQGWVGVAYDCACGTCPPPPP